MKKKKKQIVYIYYLFCEQTRKGYIGYSIHPDQRYREHLKANSYIGKMLRKHGPENFDFTILASAKSYEEAEDLERAYILEYSTRAPDGYNLTEGNSAQ